MSVNRCQACIRHCERREAAYGCQLHRWPRRRGFAPSTVAGRGGCLILEYQKSAPTPAGNCANDRVVVKSSLRQYLARAWACVSQPALAQWVGWGADDFWYSSMRKPPGPPAARIQGATLTNARHRRRSHPLPSLFSNNEHVERQKFPMRQAQNHSLFTHSMRRPA